MMAGHISTAQSIEVLKTIAGVGHPTTGRLGLYGALEQNWMFMKAHKDPNRTACSEHPTVTELIDYEDFYGINLYARSVDPSIPIY